MEWGLILTPHRKQVYINSAKEVTCNNVVNLSTAAFGYKVGNNMFMSVYIYSELQVSKCTADCSDLAIQIQNSKTKNLHSLLSSSPTPKPFERRLCKFWLCCSGFHVARSLQSAVKCKFD